METPSESLAPQTEHFVQLQVICLDLESRKEAYRPTLDGFMAEYWEHLGLPANTAVVDVFLGRLFPDGVPATFIAGKRVVR